MRRIAAVTLLVCVSSLTAAGQTGTISRSTASGLIMGRVVDGATEKPVAGVVVTLTADSGVVGIPSGPGPGGVRNPPQSVVTDAQGRFLFHDLPAGRFSFAVKSSAAWFGGGYGVRRPGGLSQPFELTDGQRASDVTLRVWKYASASGTVLDQFGDPLIETRVAVIKLDYVAGRRRYGSRSEALTDDRGVYRIGHLEPGDYVACLPFTEVTLPASVVAAADDDERNGPGTFREQLWASGVPDLYVKGFRIGEFTLARQSTAYGMNGPIGPMFTTPPPGADGQVLTYPFQFYPNATRPADATVLTLLSGEDRSSTDFQTRLMTSVRVSGRVAGPDGSGGHLGIRILPQAVGDTADERAVEIASTISDATGAFTFLGVPPGAYVIKVASMPPPRRPPPPSGMTMTAGDGSGIVGAVGPPPSPATGLPDTPSLSGAQPLSVGDTDLAGIDIPLQAGPRMSGRIVYEGTKDPLTAGQLAQLKLTIDPVDGRTGPGLSSFGQFEADGQFKTVGVLPGRYLLHVTGNLAGWTLKSAVVGGRDITDDALVVEGTPITGVLITLAEHASSVFGTVRDAQGAPDRNADVLVFPIDRARWTDNGASPRRERLTRAAATGTFEFSNLPTGEYYLVAIDDKLAANWSDPARLEKFAAAATRVTVNAASDRRTQDLVTVTIR